jgi:uncharacterized lipoprotein YmbA
MTYYTLESTVPTEAKRSSPAPLKKETPAISVETPTLPELVDRPQLVERIQGNQIEIHEFHRWAEPLKSTLPRLLADNLSRQLGSERVSSYPQNSGSNADFRVFVDFQHFESEGSTVSIDAIWSIRRMVDGMQKTGRTKIQELAGGSGYEAVITAYNRALTAVSGDIARSFQTEWSTAANNK